ncbi:GNAT family N-acetyltransferase [Halorarum halobium]|uniref:GNAT family N-acetyltransferase n=1 Tax=Halorarum halobium TaxID=3075121 RepID=UPI0028AC95E0|nr:GNAT family N-acetyltransferase [Halobaculum sp. XH14]
MTYELREGPPSVDDFQRLRAAAGMSDRPRAGVERGLSKSVFAVRVVSSRDGSEGPGKEDGDGGEERGENDDADRREGGDRGDEMDRQDDVVGMARVVGDGGSVYHVCDMAVHPDHQRRGLGARLMDAVMTFVEADAPPGAYVNLMADVDGFYERFGFEETRPASKGMFYRVE